MSLDQLITSALNSGRIVVSKLDECKCNDVGNSLQEVPYIKINLSNTFIAQYNLLTLNTKELPNEEVLWKYLARNLKTEHIKNSVECYPQLLEEIIAWENKVINYEQRTKDSVTLVVLGIYNPNWDD